MNCHSNVLNWNDSAAEEAFQNAKRRYWANINSLPCDISLPDSDTYVDQIDWNPYINPELIKDLEREYFAPPDEEERNAVNYRREKFSENVANSQECDDTKLNKALENKVHNQHELDNHYDGPANLDSADNPWECCVTSENGGLADNAWGGGGVKLWGWNQVSGHNNHSRNWGCGYNKRWSKVWDGSWNQKQSDNLFNVEKPWECMSNRRNRAPMGRGWRNCEENSSKWKQQKNAYVSGDLQFRRKCGDWTARNRSFENRERSHQSALHYDRSRFRGDDNQTGDNWRRKDYKRRVSFACE